MKEKRMNDKSVIERKYYDKFVIFKMKLLDPLLKLFSNLGITANMVSFFSLFLSLIAAAVLLIDIKISLILFLIHYLLDGVDGALARYTNACSNKGALIDAITDFVGIGALTIMLSYTNLITGWIAVSYIFFYIGMTVLAYIRDSNGRPAKIIFRPRWLFLIVLFIFALFNFNILNETLLVFTGIMALIAIDNFRMSI